MSDRRETGEKEREKKVVLSTLTLLIMYPFWQIGFLCPSAILKFKTVASGIGLKLNRKTSYRTAFVISMGILMCSFDWWRSDSKRGRSQVPRTYNISESRVAHCHRRPLAWVDHCLLYALWTSKCPLTLKCLTSQVCLKRCYMILRRNPVAVDYSEKRKRRVSSGTIALLYWTPFSAQYRQSGTVWCHGLVNRQIILLAHPQFQTFETFRIDTEWSKRTNEEQAVLRRILSWRN